MNELPYRVEHGPVETSGDFDAITLVSTAADLSVSFVPAAGMVGCSLRSGGVELLGQREGIAAYVDQGATFGIPLLAPWANRLGSDVYTAAGVRVDVAGTPRVFRDPNGLPLHGLLAGATGWDVTHTGADSTCAKLSAALTFDAHRMEFQAFPFPHRLDIDVRLQGSEVEVTTSITATAEVAVPVAFGWHPYFAFPGEPRAHWQLQLPFTTRLALTSQLLPTGEVEQWSWVPGPLAERTLDDIFPAGAPGTVVTLAGARRTIALEYRSGYPYAVLYAPDDDPVVAIEPMTAPTDPFAGTFDPVVVEPGESYSATFSIGIGQEAT